MRPAITRLYPNTVATQKSYDLVAREVMPHFQSSGGGLQAAADRAQAQRSVLAEKQMKAVEEATARHEEDVAEA